MSHHVFFLVTSLFVLRALTGEKRSSHSYQQFGLFFFKISLRRKWPKYNFNDLTWKKHTSQDKQTAIRPKASVFGVKRMASHPTPGAERAGAVQIAIEACFPSVNQAGIGWGKKCPQWPTSCLDPNKQCEWEINHRVSNCRLAKETKGKWCHICVSPVWRNSKFLLGFWILSFWQHFEAWNLPYLSKTL